MTTTSRQPVRSLLTLALLALVALVGCATSDGLAPGRAAPELAVDGWVNTRAGTATSVAGNRGKHLLVEFFSMHCPHCRDRVPEMRDIARTYCCDDLEVLSVHVPMGKHDDTAEAIAAYAKKAQLPFPVAVDRMGTTLTHFEFGYLPHACLIGPDGRVVWAGPMASDDVAEQIRKALGAGESGSAGAAGTVRRSSVRPSRVTASCASCVGDDCGCPVR